MLQYLGVRMGCVIELDEVFIEVWIVKNSQGGRDKYGFEV